MECPKCGLVQQQGAECGGCGIIIAKYLKRKKTPIQRRRKIRVSYGFLEIEEELRNYYHTQFVLLHAGLSTVEAHANFLANTKKLKDFTPYHRITSKLAEGRPASQAMAMSEDYFPAHHAKLILAGETSGNPDEIYRELHDIVDQKLTTYATIRRELRRPMITLFASVFILPLPILFSTGLMAYLKSSLVPLLVTLAVVYFCFKLFQRLMKGRYILLAIDRVLLKFPLYKIYQTNQFIRIFRTLYSAGVDNASAFAISISVLSNTALAKILTSFQPGIKQGNSLASIIRRTGVFPSELEQFVATGEASGKLDVSLKKYLDISDDNFKHRLSRFATMLSFSTGLIVMLYVAYQIIQGFTELLPG